MSINKSIQYYYLKTIENKTDELLKQIIKDFGNDYDINFQQLKDYISTYDLEFNVTNTNKITKYKKKEIKEELRCQARIWGDGYLNIKHYLKYHKKKNKLDPTQFGKQCHNIISKNNIYCSGHLNNLVHGNYYLLPPNKIIGYYLKVNRHKFI